MKKFDKQDHQSLVTWAADCAERVLALFEKAHSKDNPPRKAIEACRTWARTGVFKMATIREASLAAHIAARETKQNEAASFAARAAGQAVATAHVPQHAFGAAYYALKAVAASDPANAASNVAKEFEWQLQHVPENLSEEIRKRVLVQENHNRVVVRIRKGEDF